MDSNYTILGVKIKRDKKLTSGLSLSALVKHNEETYEVTLDLNNGAVTCYSDDWGYLKVEGDDARVRLLDVTDRIIEHVNKHGYTTEV